MRGKTILRKTTKIQKASDIQFDVGEYSEGIYFIKIIIGEKLTIEKFVVY